MCKGFTGFLPEGGELRITQGGSEGFVNVSSPIPALRKAVGTMLVQKGKSVTSLVSLLLSLGISYIAQR